MQIVNTTTREQWNDVVLYLTTSEAAELRDALNAILEDPGPGEHVHVSSSDYRQEITVLIAEE